MRIGKNVLAVMAAAGLCAVCAISAPKTASKTASKPAKKTETIKLLTANIGNMSISEAAYNRKFKAPYFDLSVIKTNLNKISPDVIFIQEIDREGLDSEKVTFPGKYSVQCSGELCVGLNKDRLEYIEDCELGDGYYLCTAHLINKSPVKEECKKEKEDYVCTAKRTLKKSEAIKLFNVHTASPLDDKDFAQRRAQICGALEKIAAFDKEGYTVLMGGDYNYDPSRDKSSSLMKKGVIDELANLNQCWDATFSDQSGNKLRVVNSYEPTWGTREVSMLGLVKKKFEKCLDHVVSNMRAEKCTIMKDDKNRLDMTPEKNKGFMDHKAVVCDMIVK